MKFTKSQTFLSALALAAVIFCAAPPVARAQNYPNFQQNVLTNGPVIFPTASITNLSALSKPIPIRPGKGIAYLPYAAAAGATTTNIVLQFNVTADGSNYSTTLPLSGALTLNGTTASRGYILFTAQQLDNVRFIRLDQATNASAQTVYLTNVVVSYGNQ